MPLVSYFTCLLTVLTGLLVALPAGLNRLTLDTAPTETLYLVFGMTGLMIAIVFLGAAVCGALFILMTRGPQAISYRPLAKCADWLSWALWTWDYKAGGVAHVGFRMLGLNVAVMGRLVS